MIGPRRGAEGSHWRGAGEVSSLAMTFAFAVLIGVFGGQWIGGKLGSETMGVAVGLTFGVTAAFLELYRTVRKMNRRGLSRSTKDDHDEESN